MCRWTQAACRGQEARVDNKFGGDNESAQYTAPVGHEALTGQQALLSKINLLIIMHSFKLLWLITEQQLLMIAER